MRNKSTWSLWVPIAHQPELISWGAEPSPLETHQDPWVKGRFLEDSGSLP